MVVLSPDPTLEEGKGFGDFGQKLGPANDPRRNLHILILTMIAASAQSYVASYPGSRGRGKESLVSVACACA